MPRILIAKGLFVTGNGMLSDKVPAVAVLSIDYEFNWTNTSMFGGTRQSHSGCALNIVILNRTEKAIDHFWIGQQCYLIDENMMSNSFSFRLLTHRAFQAITEQTHVRL